MPVKPLSYKPSSLKNGLFNIIYGTMRALYSASRRSVGPRGSDGVGSRSPQGGENNCKAGGTILLGALSFDRTEEHWYELLWRLSLVTREKNLTD